MGFFMELACNFSHITLSNNLLVEIRMELVVNCIDLNLKNQPYVFPRSSCYHPSNMNQTFFCLEMIIDHISYGHHFMTLIFVFNVIIALRSAIHDINSGKLEKRTFFWVSWWRVDLSKTFPQTHTLELVRKNEPLPLTLSPKPIFKYSKATVLSFCLCVFLNDREFGERADLQLSDQHSPRAFFYLGLQPIYKRIVVELQGISRTMFTKNQAKLFHNLKTNTQQVPAVEMKHAPANLTSKLHMFAYRDVLAQSLCILHNDCAYCTVAQTCLRGVVFHLRYNAKSTLHRRKLSCSNTHRERLYYYKRRKVLYGKRLLQEEEGIT
ncbi:hypothetical protein VP01_1733g1 [Puccinia sorghi]|uniref:Uncharacterized protein n=1 Tax=Puccinia sorghi TaxID=27349 RepID=A0A0L6VFA4_9BASI|nr:hypothetical protein VP01_1733g1 [Puccinia sorghi]